MALHGNCTGKSDFACFRPFALNSDTERLRKSEETPIIAGDYSSKYSTTAACCFVFSFYIRVIALYFLYNFVLRVLRGA